MSPCEPIMNEYSCNKSCPGKPQWMRRYCHRFSTSTQHFDHRRSPRQGTSLLTPTPSTSVPLLSMRHKRSSYIDSYADISTAKLFELVLAWLPISANEPFLQRFLLFTLCAYCCLPEKACHSLLAVILGTPDHAPSSFLHSYLPREAGDWVVL